MTAEHMKRLPDGFFELRPQFTTNDFEGNATVEVLIDKKGNTVRRLFSYGRYVMAVTIDMHGDAEIIHVAPLPIHFYNERNKAHIEEFLARYFLPPMTAEQLVERGLDFLMSTERQKRGVSE